MAWDHNGLAKEFASRLPSSNPCLTTKTQCVFSCFYIFKLILPYCLIHQFFLLHLIIFSHSYSNYSSARTHSYNCLFLEVFHGVKRNKTQKENAFLLIDIQLLLGNKHVTSCQNLLSNRIPPAQKWRGENSRIRSEGDVSYLATFLKCPYAMFECVVYGLIFKILLQKYDRKIMACCFYCLLSFPQQALVKEEKNKLFPILPYKLKIFEMLT